MQLKNLANALLLLGLLYLQAAYGYSPWYVVILAVLAIATWEYTGFSDERKELLEIEIDKAEAELDLLKAKTELVRQRVKLYANNIRIEG